MMTVMEFDVHPQSWERTGWSGSHPFTQDKTRAFEDEMKLLMQSQMNQDVITTGCTVCLVFSFATKDKKRWGKPKTTRSDIDNICKGVFDAGNGIVWEDDALIWFLAARKVWSEEDHIRMEVSVDK